MKYAIIFFISIMIFSCNTLPLYYSNLSYDSKDLNGWRVEYINYESMKITKFRNGVQDGKSIIYFNNGEQIISRYKSGLLTGKKIFFSSEDVIYKIEYFNKGNLIGFKFYTPPAE